MSATIEQIQDYILKDSRKRWKGDADYYGYYHISNDYAGYNEEYTEHIYSLQRQYNYIDVSIIRKDEEIEKLIDNKQGKWLIFVDNIQKGKKLEETLKKHKSEDEVVFIFSGYEDEVESEKQVREIINNKKQSAQILISTSVMDNGITLKDIELRNIILMADTEVEFIQMLGRKRQDGKKVQVYIYVYDKNHFVQRRQELKEKRKICVDYRTDFIQIIKEPFDSGIPRLQEFHVNNFDWENYNKCEKRLIEEQHVQVMRKIDDGIYRYGDVKSLFNVYGGTLYLNSLAMKNIENLQAYYSEIIKKFENDETNAFIREQLCWLGKEDEEVDKIIEGEIKEFYKEVKMKIDARLNKPMLKQEMNDFHKEIRIKLLEILKHECWKIGKNAKEDYETAYNTLYRSTSCISKKTMSVLSEICDLPYEIDVIQRSKDNQETTYTFRRILNEKK